MGKYIIHGFKGRAVERSGILWFSPEDAIQIIEKAKDLREPILGFDAARIHGVSAQPSLEDSWDYTLPRHIGMADKHGHAIGFIRNRLTSGLLFEVVLGEGIEFSK